MKLYFISTLLWLLSCKSGSDLTNCLENYNKAQLHISNYYQDGAQRHLDTVLLITEQLYNSCEDFKYKAANLKITALLLKKDYNQGFLFVSSLDSSQFTPSYKKNLYLYTFKALAFEAEGDTSKKDEYLEQIVNEIRNYLSQNPSDKEALTDLFYTELKYKDRRNVIAEIEALEENSNADHDFLESLKNTIKAYPEE